VLDSFPDSDSASGPASRNTHCSPNRDTPTNHGAPEFPAANSEEGLYFQNVLTAVERWFSLFGWPSGPHPISVPHTLRRYTQRLSSGAKLCLMDDDFFCGNDASSLPPELNQKFKRILPVHGLMESFKIKTPGVYMNHPHAEERKL